MAKATSGAFSAILAPGLRKVWMDDQKTGRKSITRILKVESITTAYIDELVTTGLGRLEQKRKAADHLRFWSCG